MSRSVGHINRRIPVIKSHRTIGSVNQSTLVRSINTKPNPNDQNSNNYYSNSLRKFSNKSTPDSNVDSRVEAALRQHQNSKNPQHNLNQSQNKLEEDFDEDSQYYAGIEDNDFQQELSTVKEDYHNVQKYTKLSDKILEVGEDEMIDDNDDYFNSIDPLREKSLEELLIELGHEDPEALLAQLEAYDNQRLQMNRTSLENINAELDSQMDESITRDIVPGVSAAELIKHGVSAREIIEYSKNMVETTGLSPTYEGVNLKRIGREASKQREELEEQGIDSSYKNMHDFAKEMMSVEGLSTEDLRDLEAYYDHFAGAEEDMQEINYDDDVDFATNDNNNKKIKLNDPQFPEDSHTAKALRTFSRTVPIDDPLPKELQKRVNHILSDANYMKNRDSHFFYNDLEIWYIANRLPVVFSILKRIFTEVRRRIPAFKPKNILEFAAGASPGLWSAREVFYQDFATYTCVERDGRLALMGQHLTADLGIHIHYRPKLIMETDKDNKTTATFNDYNKNKSQRNKKKKGGRNPRSSAEALKNLKEAEIANMKHDMVLVPYALSKQPNKEYRRLLLESLWDQVNPKGGVLVLLESAEENKNGFNIIREARDYLLQSYPKASLEDTHIVQVKKGLEPDSDMPEWAQTATKKLKKSESNEPSASAILPCAHDKPCPMIAMQKLHKEFLALRKLARDNDMPTKFKNAPVTVCKFGQRMLRGPMPNQSPLQDIKVPNHLGDAVIENFSYVVIKRGEAPAIDEEDLDNRVKLDIVDDRVSAQEELEARQMAMNVFGAKSVDNEERVSHLKNKLIDEKVADFDENEDTLNQIPGKKARKKKKTEDELKTRGDYVDADGRLLMSKIEELAIEMGIELDEETIEIFRAGFEDSHSPKINPKLLFNEERWARIVSTPLKRGGHVIMDLCTPEGTIERRIVGRQGVGTKGFKQGRVGKWGDVWPYKKAITARELKEKQHIDTLSSSLNVSASDAKIATDELDRIFSKQHVELGDVNLLSDFNQEYKKLKEDLDSFGKDIDLVKPSSQTVEKVEDDVSTNNMDDIIAQMEAAIQDQQKKLNEVKKLKASTVLSKTISELEEPPVEHVKYVEPPIEKKRVNANPARVDNAIVDEIQEILQGTKSLDEKSPFIPDYKFYENDDIDEDIDVDFDEIDDVELALITRQKQQQDKVNAVIQKIRSNKTQEENSLKSVANKWLSANTLGQNDVVNEDTRNNLMDILMMDDFEDVSDNDTDGDYEQTFAYKNSEDFQWESKRNQSSLLEIDHERFKVNDNMDFELDVGGALDAVDENSTVQNKLKMRRIARGEQLETDRNDYIIEDADGNITISIDPVKQAKREKQQRGWKKPVGKRFYSTTNGMLNLGMSHHSSRMSSNLMGSTINAGMRNTVNYCTMTGIRNYMSASLRSSISHDIKASLTGAPIPVVSAKSSISTIITRAFRVKRGTSENDLAKFISRMDPEDNIPSQFQSKETGIPKKKKIIKTAMKYSKDHFRTPVQHNKPIDPFAKHHIRPKSSLIDDMFDIHNPLKKEINILEPGSALRDRNQVHSIINNQFRFDGVMGLEDYDSQMRAILNARKMQKLAGMDDVAPGLDGTQSAGKLPNNVDKHEQISHITATASPVHNDDPRSHRKKSEYDDGILLRDFKPGFIGRVSMKEWLENKDEDLFNDHFLDIYQEQERKAATRTTEFGTEVMGELDAAKMKLDRQYTDNLRDMERKLRSRKKDRQFREQLEYSKKQLVEASGGIYTPPHNSANYDIDKYVEAGKDGQKPSYQSLEDKIKLDIAKIKEERAEANRKNIVYTGLDLMPEEETPLQPGLRAKTQTEKRGSMAIIENDEESRVRKEATDSGLDLSLTALLTNKDGFGPQMDPLTGRAIVKDVDVPEGLEMFSAEDLEDLVDYADNKSLLKARAIVKAAKSVAKNAKGQPLKLKLKKAIKAEDDDDLQILPDLDQEDPNKRISFSVVPLSQEEVDDIHNEKNKKTFTQMLPDGTVVDTNIIDALTKAPKPSERLITLADRFQDLVRMEEERALLAEQQFTPVDVPDMHDAWSVKNRAPDTMTLGKQGSAMFNSDNRTYDRVMAEFQEAELLEKLGAFSDINLPPGTAPSSGDLERELSLEDLRLALEFEKSMLDAQDKAYAQAKKKIISEISGKTNTINFDDIPKSKSNPPQKTSKLNSKPNPIPEGVIEAEYTDIPIEESHGKYHKKKVTFPKF